VLEFAVSAIPSRKLPDRRPKVRKSMGACRPTKTPEKFVNLNGNAVLVLITISVFQTLLKGYRGTNKIQDASDRSQISGLFWLDA
jgi:hypothetical protein